jgi:hypothetical protein
MDIIKYYYAVFQVLYVCLSYQLTIYSLIIFR